MVVARVQPEFGRRLFDALLAAVFDSLLMPRAPGRSVLPIAAW
jgi:hypothetical protein